MPSAFTVPAFGPGWIFAIVIIGGISITIELFRSRKDSPEDIPESIVDRVILKILIPREGTLPASAMQQLLASIHSLIGQQEEADSHISLEIASTASGIYFLLVCASDVKKYIEGQIYAAYPEAEVSEMDDYTTGFSALPGQEHISITEGQLQKASLFPIKDITDFTYDPITSLLAAMSNLRSDETVGLQILIRAVNDKWKKEGAEYARRIRAGKSPNSRIQVLKDFVIVLSRIYNGILSPQKLKIKSRPVLSQHETDQIALVEKKNKDALYIFRIRIIASSPDKDSAATNVKSAVAALQQFDVFELNRLIFTEFTRPQDLSVKITEYKTRTLDMDIYDVLAANELAGLYHLPTSAVHAPQVQWLKARKAAAPVNLPTSGCVYLGETNTGGMQVKFGVKPDDRRKHMYILGKTGSGKTTLMKQMIIQDILNGEGVCVIDPHGELVEDILTYIPPIRKDDVVLVDPSDTDYPVALNIFSYTLERQRDYIASSILSVFKKQFDSWGPRLEYILHNIILTLLQTEGATILGIQRILTDPFYRRYVVSQIQDPLLVKFWNEEYAYMERNSRLITETIAPIQNKVGRFLSSPIVRNMIGQAHTKVDLGQIMNTKKILLCNLSQGKLGEDNSALLGALIITKLQTSAMERVSILESERQDFYVYIDEFQNFSTGAFTKIFSEARKYRLNMVLANQYLFQLHEDIRSAIFGNVGTCINFTVGSQDAYVLEKEYAPVFTANDLMNLEKHEIYIKEMIDGTVAKPFSANTLQVAFPRYHIEDAIREHSRAMYATDRTSVEDAIRIWAMKSFNVYDAYKNKQGFDRQGGQITPNNPLRLDL